MTQAKKPAATKAAAKTPAKKAPAGANAAADATAAAGAVHASPGADAVDAAAVQQAETDRAAAQMAELGMTRAGADQTVTEKAVSHLDAKKPPERVVLLAPYAYYDDEGQLRSWTDGMHVTDRDEIVDLINRVAPIDVPQAEADE